MACTRGSEEEEGGCGGYIKNMASLKENCLFDQVYGNLTVYNNRTPRTIDPTVKNFRFTGYLMYQGFRHEIKMICADRPKNGG